MTEQEYIDATDLGKVRAARKVLTEVIPEVSDRKMIDKKEYQKVMKILFKWEERLSDKIEITTE